MERPKIRKELWISIFIVGIMTLSTIGYVWIGQTSSNKIRYNNQVFTLENNKWTTKIGENKIGFDFLPTEVQEINMSREVSNKLYNAKLLQLTFDPEQKEIEYTDYVRFELESVLSQKTGKTAVKNGVLNQSETYPLLPVIDCANSTEFEPVIKFLKTNRTKIYDEENCIIVETTNYVQAIAAKDRILYSIFNILK